MSTTLKEIMDVAFQGGFFIFIGNALSSFILAVGSIIIARLLGPEVYGIYALSLVVQSIFVGIGDLGINTALTRFSAKLRSEGKPQVAAAMLRSGLIFKFLLGMGLAVVCFTFSDVLAIQILNRPEISNLIKLSSPLIPLQALFGASRASFTGLDRIKVNTIVINLQAIVKTSTSLWFLSLGITLVGVLLGHILGFTFASLVSLGMLYRYYRELGNPASPGFARHLQVMLHYSYPLYFSALLTFLVGHYNNVILAYFVTNVEIGNFNVARTLSNLVTVLTFPSGLLLSAFAKIKPGTRTLTSLFNLALKYTTLIIIPATIFVAVASPELVHLLYGPRYELAPLFLTLYILIFLYATVGSMVLGNLLNGLGETTITFKGNLIASLVQIPLVPTLTLIYGVSGLIIALHLSTLSSVGYLLYKTAKTFDLHLEVNPPLKITFISLLAVIPLIILLYILPLSPFNLILGGIIYLILLLTLIPTTKVLTTRELYILRQTLQTMPYLYTLANPFLKYEEIILKLLSAT